jgi:D-lactate dehydrogenase
MTTDAAECLAYGYDNSRRQAQPDAVVFPTSHEDVVALVNACRDTRVPITARGRGTNTTGATVPIAGGIVVSFERMNRIVRIDADNRYALVEPGVLNGDLQTALAAHGFFWPPDPTSSAYCSIGGNLACNAGGPRAVKYGTCRENTLGLRAVAGTGEEFRCGTYTTKGATGYDLTRLLIGAEGTLALITEATLKLTPKPAAKRTLSATYVDVRAAAAAVARIMAQPVVPCALEFMDDESLRLSRERGVSIPAAGAMLIIEVDGNEDDLSRAVDAVAEAARGDGMIELRIAADTAETDALWSARKALSPALREISPNKINEDVVVPVAQLPQLIDTLRDISARHRVPIVSFGHPAARRGRVDARGCGIERPVRSRHRARRHPVRRARHRHGETRVPASGDRCGRAIDDAENKIAIRSRRNPQSGKITSGSRTRACLPVDSPHCRGAMP